MPQKTCQVSSTIDRKDALIYTPAVLKIEPAEVAELADAHDSNSCSLGSVGSIPTFGIRISY